MLILVSIHSIECLSVFEIFELPCAKCLPSYSLIYKGFSMAFSQIEEETLAFFYIYIYNLHLNSNVAKRIDSLEVDKCGMSPKRFCK